MRTPPRAGRGDDGAFRHCGRLVENKPALFDTRAQRGHLPLTLDVLTRTTDSGAAHQLANEVDSPEDVPDHEDDARHAAARRIMFRSPAHPLTQPPRSKAR